MINLIYILFASMLCMWINNETSAICLIFYLMLFYCFVEKIVFRTVEIFKTKISIEFVIAIIGILLIYLNKQ